VISRVSAMILGVLSERERHGYDLLREMGDRGMLRWASASKVGIYKALARLQEQGYLTSWTERDGNLPEKRVYAITAAGEEGLRDMVYSLCSSNEPIRQDIAIGLAFIDHLGQQEAREALQQRCEFLKAQERRLGRERGLLKGLASEMILDIMGREQASYREELRWLKAVIGRIESGGRIAAARGGTGEAGENLQPAREENTAR